jgi:hypothetical protein
MYIDCSYDKETPKIEINWSSIGGVKKNIFEKWHKDFGTMIELSKYVEDNLITQNYDIEDTYEYWEKHFFNLTEEVSK